MTQDLEDIIRRAQDRVRGRPKNWRDKLHDWWCDFSFHDHIVWPFFGAVVFIYTVMVVGLVVAEIFR